MTGDPSRAHADAIHALLDQFTPYTIYLGQVTDADADLTYPYLLMWPPPGSRDRNSLNGTGGTVTTTTQVTAVGRDPTEVLTALDRAADALQGVTPTIAGRGAGQIHQPEDFTPPPITQDDTTRTQDGRPVFMGVAMYRLISAPA